MKPDMTDKVANAYYNPLSSRKLVSAFEFLGYKELGTIGKFSGKLEELVEKAKTEYNQGGYDRPFNAPKEQLTTYEINVKIKGYRNPIWQNHQLAHKPQQDINMMQNLGEPIKRLSSMDFPLESVKEELLHIEKSIQELTENLRVKQDMIHVEIIELRNLRNEIMMLRMHFERW